MSELEALEAAASFGKLLSAPYNHYKERGDKSPFFRIVKVSFSRDSFGYYLEVYFERTDGKVTSIRDCFYKGADPVRALEIARWAFPKAEVCNHCRKSVVVGFLICKPCVVSFSDPKRRSRESIEGQAYAIKDLETGLIKLGHSSDPSKRIATLQTGSAGELKLIRTFDKISEEALHAYFADKRIRGEWFEIAEGDLPEDTEKENERMKKEVAHHASEHEEKHAWTETKRPIQTGSVR